MITGDTLKTFQLFPGVFILGCTERGVTVYKQQVRAHNLSSALLEEARHGRKPLKRVAIVGSGIGGLTAAACLARRLEKGTSVSIFEKAHDLCPLQQGCDTRWLHPNIYSWPAEGAMSPNALLPMLNWKAGRASDVARTILKGFANVCAMPPAADIEVFLAVDSLRVKHSDKTIEWAGHRTKAEGGHYVTTGERVSGTDHFDVIVLAVGFGLEPRMDRFPTTSYWRNEGLSQPYLGGATRTYVVSGYGDGALVDVARLTIERYRQDEILFELFDGTSGLEEVAEELRAGGAAASDNVLEFFKRKTSGDEWLRRYAGELRHRIRKDTRVLLHAAGRENHNDKVETIFGPSSAFHNRLITLLLVHAGAVSPQFCSLDEILTNSAIDPANVVCRHGTPPPADVLRGVLRDATEVDGAIKRMRAHGEQAEERLFRPDFYE